MIGALLQRGRSLATAERQLFHVVVIPVSELQRGRSLATAERRGRRRRRGRRAGFNGAAVLRLRKGLAMTLPGYTVLVLQRGRSLATAERIAGSAMAMATPCFNGAAVLRLRKAHVAAHQSRGARGFNGAAVLRLRKVSGAGKNHDAILALQRGRSLATAESAESPMSCPSVVVLQRGRSLATAESAAREAEPLRLLDASTGPQSCDCGKQRIANEHRRLVLSLQRGRSLATAESQPGVLVHAAQERASTGPQSCDCGKRRRRDRHAVDEHASTGPQSCDCGKETRRGEKRFPVLLQRGRSLATAESRTIRAPSGACAGFNGAAVLRLRKGSPRPCRSPSWPCFNGAAVLRLRKGRAWSPGPSRVARFNGAAVLRLRKVVQQVGRASATLASTGPQSCDCGKRKPDISDTRLRRLQRGRSLATAERRIALAWCSRCWSFNGAAVLRLRKALWRSGMSLRPS